MNRRKFTATVGAMVASTGALLGTGAFSTVSAERSFSVSTADDQRGLLELRKGSSPVAEDVINETATGEGTILNFDFPSNMNEKAVTSFDGILEVVNNTTQNGLAVTELVFQPEDASGNTITASGTNSGNNPVGVYKVTNTSSNSEKDPFDSDFHRKGSVDNKITSFPDGGADLTRGESVEVGFVIDTTGSTDIDDIANVRVVAKTAQTGP